MMEGLDSHLGGGGWWRKLVRWIFLFLFGFLAFLGFLRDKESIRN
jgi:hypothetical protein